MVGDPKLEQRTTHNQIPHENLRSLNRGHNLVILSDMNEELYWRWLAG